jgi:hypothetical protein
MNETVITFKTAADLRLFNARWVRATGHSIRSFRFAKASYCFYGDDADRAADYLNAL